MNSNERPITESQIDYYSARAPEYDEWWLRQGRYRKSDADNDAWFREAAACRCGRRRCGGSGPDRTAPAITFVEANVLTADFPSDLDLVFAGCLFSHIPHEERDRLVRRCLAALRPGGTLAFVDSRSDPLSGSGDTEIPAPELQRRTLNDGRTFDVIKIYDEPDALRELFARCGATQVQVRQTDRFFWFATCTRPV